MESTGPAEAGPVAVSLPEGGTLHAEVQGAGSTLLLIQGLGYAVWAWRYQVPAFAERYRVVAFDNRGAGRSFKPPPPYSIEQLADDAARVLEHVGDGAAHVVGLSMGGYVAQMLALRRPDLVRSLVLAGTSAGGPTATPVPQSTLDVWLAAAGSAPPEYARRTMYLSFSPGWTDEHPSRYERLLAARLEFPTPPECWRAQYDACDVFLARGVPAERIHVPALVVHGDADRIVPVENGRTLASRLPRGRLVELPARGHVSQLEDPETFNRVVLDFLAEVEAP